MRFLEKFAAGEGVVDLASQYAAFTASNKPLIDEATAIVQIGKNFTKDDEDYEIERLLREMEEEDAGRDAPFEKSKVEKGRKSIKANIVKIGQADQNRWL